MASETYDIVAEPAGATLGAGEVNIVNEYPSQFAQAITEQSRGVSLPQLRVLRDRAAGRYNALLTSRGFTPSTLDVDAKELVRAGIIAYAIGKTLMRVGESDLGQTYLDEHEEMLATLRERVDEMGDSQPSGSQIRTNVDTSSTRAKKTWGKDFFGW